MRSDVVTIEAGEQAGAAWSMMRQRRIRHLMVTAGENLVGVLSERDLGGQHGARVRKGKKVGDLMSTNIVSAAPTMTLRQAANLMRGRLVGALPVVEDDRLIGIVTATDVLDELGRGFTRPDVGTRRRQQRATPSNRSKSDDNPTVHRRSRAQPRTQGPLTRTPDSPRRSPPPAWNPRADKRELGKDLPMSAHIRTEGVKLSPAERTYLRRRLGMRLGKFSSSIERLTVRIRDINGPRGGVDTICRIKAVLNGQPSVIVESRADSHHIAINRALDQAQRTLRRTLDRKRRKQLRSAA